MAKESFFITKDFDIQVVKTVLKRNWWILVTCIFGALLLAFFVMRYTKPVYQSAIVLQLSNNDKAKDVLEIENIGAGNSSFNSNLELLRSQFLFEKAIEKLNVSVSLFQEGQILSEEKYTSSCFNVQPYELKDSSLINVPIYLNLEEGNLELSYLHNGEKIALSGRENNHLINKHFDVLVKIIDHKMFKELVKKDKLYFTFNSINSLTSKFLPNLIVTPLDPTAQTVELRFEAYNPYFCTDFVNSLATTFFNYELELKRQGNENIINFIDNQLDSLSNELKSSKDSLVIFQRNSNLIDPDNASMSLSENVSRLQEQLYTIEDELFGLNKVASKLSKEPSRLEIYRLLPEMLGKSYQSSLSKQIEDLHELLERKENLLFSVTDENPEIKSISLRISTKKDGIRKSIAILQSRLSENSKIIRSKIGSLQGNIFQIPEKKMEYGRLKNIQELNDKYFSLLTEKKVMYGISNAGFSSMNRILSKAITQTSPIRPNKNRFYLTLVGFGFLIGIVILFIKYVRFNEVSYLEDLKKILPKNLSYLGTIPLITETMDFSELLVSKNPKSMVAESMRNIRVNLGFVSPNFKVIAVSSSVSGEGKTFVSLNLAAIIAMTGKKTVLLDLDLRKPKVHLAMNSTNKIGMSNVLVNQSTWQECIVQSEVENLSFLTAGPVPPNPSELLLGTRMEEVLEELKKEFDIILIDNPPVGVVSDGVHLLAKSDIPIYVFKAHFSKRSFAEKVEELVDVQKIKKLSLILNGEVKSNKSYGYNYAYFSDENNPKTKLSKILKQ